VPDMHLNRQVRGDALSCYTTSIGGYMEAVGIDHELAIGSQCYVAIRFEGESRPEVLHYHTPLVGELRTHSLHLVRRRAADGDAAVAAIAEECSRRRAVVVVGDTMRLPWLVTAGKRHGPHWFLVDGVDGDRLHVTDRFAFTDECGVQEPYRGWLSASSLGLALELSPLVGEQFQQQEQWAFGRRESSVPLRTDGFQWFVATSDAAAHEVDRRVWIERVCANVEWGSGLLVRRDHGGQGWCQGPEAVRQLAAFVHARLAHPSLYAMRNDLWVVARTRQMFGHVLARIARDFDLPAAGELTAWIERELLPPWFNVTKLMRYNAAVVERGRAPNETLFHIISSLVRLEASLLDRIRELMSGCLAAS
jgi:hypothetical protein